MPNWNHFQRKDNVVCPLNSETKLSYSVKNILNEVLKGSGGNNDGTKEMESRWGAMENPGVIMGRRVSLRNHSDFNDHMFITISLKNQLGAKFNMFFENV